MRGAASLKMRSCSVRALWILIDDHKVCFSRRFPAVERQWRNLYSQVQRELEGSQAGAGLCDYTPLPPDADLARAVALHYERLSVSRAGGVREAQSAAGTSAWLDDPLTRHVISLSWAEPDPPAAGWANGSPPRALSANGGEGEPGGRPSHGRLWPLAVHSKGPFRILVLPLVDPRQLAVYQELSRRRDCGGPGHGGRGESLADLVRSCPAVTGAFAVAHALADVMSEEPPELAASVGGLLDSLSAGMGLPVRPKGAPAPGPGPAPASAPASAAPPKPALTAAHRDALRSFVSSAMPFGVPLDLNPATVAAARGPGEGPPGPSQQPAWKPLLLHGGRQRILLRLQETITAALYDRDEVSDVVSISGLVKCRCDLEGLPEVSLCVTAPQPAGITAWAVHPCCQAPEAVPAGPTLLFTPPLGPFELARYQAQPAAVRFPVQGFYQLQMVAEDEAQFLIKLKLMEGYRAPACMELCTLSLPFPRRTIAALDGAASLGTVSSGEHVVEWRILAGGRGSAGRSVEVTFPGTLRFTPLGPRARAGQESEGLGIGEGGGRGEEEIPGSWAEEEELPRAEWEAPFCWDAYDHAKVNFKLVGGTVSGASLDSKKVGLYPAMRVPVEVSSEVVTGDYVIFNSLGHYPRVARPPNRA